MEVTSFLLRELEDSRLAISGKCVFLGPAGDFLKTSISIHSRVYIFSIFIATIQILSLQRMSFL